METVMRKHLLNLETVSKTFANRMVLDKISMSISQGEITTVIGPNGAGKSTLLKIILGLIAPDNGTIERSSELRIGYMPQKLYVDPTLPLTTHRFLRLADVSASACDEALALTGISDLKNNSFQSLSGGEIQRVLLARAILRRPNLLVLDEPVQGVDINGQNELYRIITNLKETLNCGVVLVSHDLHLVMSDSDHVICLNQHICCQGKPEKVTQDPAYINIFGNTSVYNHHHNHQHTLHGQIVDGEGCQHD
jgi:zinc transport system ATP-binding protein